MDVTPVPAQALQRIRLRLIFERAWAWPLQVGNAFRGALGWQLQDCDPAARQALYGDPSSVPWCLRFAPLGIPLPVMAVDIHCFSDDRALAATIQRAASGITELITTGRASAKIAVVACEVEPLLPVEDLREAAEALAASTTLWSALTPLILSRGHQPLGARSADLGDLLAAAERSVLAAAHRRPSAHPGQAPVLGRAHCIRTGDTRFPYKGASLPALSWQLAAESLPTQASRHIIAASWFTGMGRCVRVGAGAVMAVA